MSRTRQDSWRTLARSRVPDPKLLPVRSAAGDTTAPEVLGATRAEIIKQFGRLTAYVRSLASGAWTSPEGDVEEDNVVMIEAWQKRSIGPGGAHTRTP
jgi:hypothetical protein